MLNDLIAVGCVFYICVIFTRVFNKHENYYKTHGIGQDMGTICKINEGELSVIEWSRCSSEQGHYRSCNVDRPDDNGRLCRRCFQGCELYRSDVQARNFGPRRDRTNFVDIACALFKYLIQ